LPVNDYFETWTVTLKIRVNRAQFDPPPSWGWHKLLDLLPEDVAVVEAKLEKPTDEKEAEARDFERCPDA
jgi:hypothetical protein